MWDSNSPPRNQESHTPSAEPARCPEKRLLETHGLRSVGPVCSRAVCSLGGVRSTSFPALSGGSRAQRQQPSEPFSSHRLPYRGMPSEAALASPSPGVRCARAPVLVGNCSASSRVLPQRKALSGSNDSQGWPECPLRLQRSSLFRDGPERPKAE